MWPPGPQSTRLPCSSLSPGVCSHSCPLSQWCHPTISSSVSPFSFCLQSPSIRVFSNESALCMRWPKYWSYSFNIHPSNEYSGLISLRIDWFHLFAIQEALKSLLHHHNLKASILWHSAVFTVQLSHPYVNTGTIALTIWTFVGKVMALFFTMLSKYVTAFLLRSKHLLTSWLQSLEPKKITSAIVCTFPPPVCHEVMGPDAMIFVFECWVLSQLFHSLFFIFIKRLFSSSSLSAARVVWSAYFRLLIYNLISIWLIWGNLDSSCDSSSLAFHNMYSA